MITDTIGDMVARIKNAYLARHKVVEVPYSKINLQIGQILAEQKYIVSAEVIGDTPASKAVKLVLRYQRKDPAIQDIKRISKPGLRIYKQVKELKVPLGGLGVGIISTSQGVMTVKQAKKKNLGGELLCEVW